MAREIAGRTWASCARSTQSTAEHRTGVRWHVAFCAEATAYSEPDVSFTTGMANRANQWSPEKKSRTFPSQI